MEAASPSVVRAWARENGHVVSDRGRVPLAVQRAFDEAHAAEPTPPAPELPVAQPALTADPFAPPAGNPWSSAPPPPPERETGRDGFSVAALVLGILPLFGGLLGIIFGGVALGRIRRTGRDGRGMAITGIVLGSLWLAAVLAVVVIAVTSGPERGDGGAVTQSGDVVVKDLRVDDCIASVPDQVRLLTVVPCDQPHEATVYAIFPLAGAGYPGDAAVEKFARGGCVRRLTERFGAQASQEYSFISPAKDNWTAGDHDVTCLAHSAPEAAG
jgi:hypothetical protein